MCWSWEGGYNFGVGGCNGGARALGFFGVAQGRVALGGTSAAGVVLGNIAATFYNFGGGDHVVTC